MVIAVLWIVAAITIPNLPVFLEANRMARSQKNAMALADLSLAAKNTGCPALGSRSEAVLSLINGFTVMNPAATNVAIRFQAKYLTPSELAAAAEFLTYDGKSLIYVPAGGQPTNLEEKAETGNLKPES